LLKRMLSRLNLRNDDAGLDCSTAEPRNGDAVGVAHERCRSESFCSAWLCQENHSCIPFEIIAPMRSLIALNFRGLTDPNMCNLRTRKLWRRFSLQTAFTGLPG
jgi:hypothetical protein